MHMQHVNTEAIPLVKGPVTHRTWKLSVSLIHTACVFKVAVSVILVGKNFTAPFARETAKNTCNKFNNMQLNEKKRSASLKRTQRKTNYFLVFWIPTIQNNVKPHRTQNLEIPLTLEYDLTLFSLVGFFFLWQSLDPSWNPHEHIIAVSIPNQKLPSV